MTLAYETKFDETFLPAPWKGYESERVNPANIQISEGILNLYTSQVGGKWRGASVILEQPRTYGRFAVRVRVEPGLFTKALLMLWPADKQWPPEVDFLEMGGTDNADRHRNNMTVHYGPDNKMIHRSYEADMTRWHTVSVDWRRGYFSFMLDGEIQPNTWGQLRTQTPNPGVHGPMKLHMTYWPTHKLESDPWPATQTKMQVEWVRVYA